MLFGRDVQSRTLRGFEIEDDNLIDKVRAFLAKNPPERVFQGNLEGRPQDLKPGELEKMLSTADHSGPGPPGTASAKERETVPTV